MNPDIEALLWDGWITDTEVFNRFSVGCSNEFLSRLFACGAVHTRCTDDGIRMFAVFSERALTACVEEWWATDAARMLGKRE